MEEVGFALRRVSRTVGPGGERCAVLSVNGCVSDTAAQPHGHKPALGAGWRAADVLLRLDAVRGGAGGGEAAAGVPGLTVFPRKAVRATLVKHCAKSVAPNGRGGADLSATFDVTADGIVDSA